MDTYSPAVLHASIPDTKKPAPSAGYIFFLFTTGRGIQLHLPLEKAYATDAVDVTHMYCFILFHKAFLTVYYHITLKSFCQVL